MFTRIMAATIVMLAIAAPSHADNLQIFKAAQRQVLQYPYFTIFDSVDLQIHEGVVTLSGKVTMPFKRTDLEKRVAKVAGVTAVQNRIGVLPVSIYDDDLRLRIARAIYGSANFSPYASMAYPPIHIVVERGHVTLTGVVTSHVDRMLAHSLANHSLAFSVTNALRTNAEARAELEKL